MKVKIPVYIIATASKMIGHVEVESVEEFEDAAINLMEETDEYLSVNISNDFDLGDTDIETIGTVDFEYYKKEQADKKE